MNLVQSYKFFRLYRNPVLVALYKAIKLKRGKRTKLHFVCKYYPHMRYWEFLLFLMKK